MEPGGYVSGMFKAKTSPAQVKTYPLVEQLRIPLKAEETSDCPFHVFMNLFGGEADEALEPDIYYIQRMFGNSFSGESISKGGHREQIG